MPGKNSQTDSDNGLLRMTADVVSAYLSNNTIASKDVGGLISSVHDALNRLSLVNDEAARASLKPAIPIRRSITDDYIICLEDGKKLKMLKRYLRTKYNMTPSEYRAKWSLPADYPMVAPNYATQRSEFAKKIGLGRNRKTHGKKA